MFVRKAELDKAFGIFGEKNGLFVRVENSTDTLRLFLASRTQVMPSGIKT